MTTTTVLNPGIVQSLDEKVAWPKHPKDLAIPYFDTGVFVNEMAKLNILPEKLTQFTETEKEEFRRNPENLLEKAQEEAPGSLDEGTYRGTQLALTKLYELIEKRYGIFWSQPSI
jgi:hypothetical protein